jgi:signal transduction histidine kinase
MASVGRLAAGIAHEIGNPLGAINGYTHVLRHAALSHPNAEEALAGLERESGRIDRIVRGLLDYARARPRAQGPVDVNETARTVVELLTTQGLLKHIELHLSPAAQGAVVAGDRHDLEQAFVNLMLNAVDAMSGRGALSVIIRRTSRHELQAGGRRSNASGAPLHPPNARTLRWLESDGANEIAMVVVSDSGPGIAPEDAERVFEPFYTTKDPGKGTGLGLAIVARAIENFGGAIWVSPSREGGAAFRVLLPLMTALPRASAPRARMSPTYVTQQQ